MTLKRRVAGKADLVLRALVWLEVGRTTAYAYGSLRQNAARDRRRRALYATLLHRLGRLNVRGVAEALQVSEYVASKAIAMDAIPQDEVTEWARLVAEALMQLEVMDLRAQGETIPSWRRS
jgi:hypothetical protein